MEYLLNMNCGSCLTLQQSISFRSVGLLLDFLLCLIANILTFVINMLTFYTVDNCWLGTRKGLGRRPGSRLGCILGCTFECNLGFGLGYNLGNNI